MYISKISKKRRESSKEGEITVNLIKTSLNADDASPFDNERLGKTLEQNRPNGILMLFAHFFLSVTHIRFSLRPLCHQEVHDKMSD